MSFARTLTAHKLHSLVSRPDTSIFSAARSGAWRLLLTMFPPNTSLDDMTGKTVRVPTPETLELVKMDAGHGEPVSIMRYWIRENLTAVHPGAGSRAATRMAAMAMQARRMPRTASSDRIPFRMWSARIELPEIGAAELVDRVTCF